MGIVIKARILMDYLMGMENITGRIKILIKGILRMDFAME